MDTLLHLTEKEREALDELIQVLRGKYGSELKTIKLFGSKIRGDFDGASDIDLLLVFDREVDWKFRDEVHSLIFPVNLKYDVLFSARVYSKTRLNEAKIQALPFIQSIQKNGVTVL